jgi:hypothetical protein
MTRVRFTLASLLFAVLFLGVGFAALREASELWSSVIFTLTIGALLVSILLAIHRASPARAFWLGFALFGWAYMGLTLVPSIQSRVISTKGLAHLDSIIPGRPQVVFKIKQLTLPAPGTANAQNQATSLTLTGNTVTSVNLSGVRIWDAVTGNLLQGRTGSTEDFVNVGHSLVALLLAWVGGILSRRLGRSSRPTEESSAIATEALSIEGKLDPAL